MARNWRRSAEIRRYERAHCIKLTLGSRGLSRWIVESSDRYLIGIMLGAEAVGYYSPAYTLGNTIGLFYAPLTVLLPAVLSRHYDENRIEDVKILLKYALKYFSAIGIPIIFRSGVFIEAHIRNIIHAGDSGERLFCHAVYCCRNASSGIDRDHCCNTSVKKRNCCHWHDMDYKFSIEFRFKLSSYSLFGNIRCFVNHSASLFVRFYATTIYSLRHFKFDLNGGFVLKRVCASIAMSLLFFLWNPARILDLLLSVVVSTAVYLFILLLLRGLTIKEVKFFYNILKNPRKIV